MSVLSRRSILQLAIAPALVSRGTAQHHDLPPTVSRIHPGADGRLVYVPDEQGNTILDWSHAGYGGGGVPIRAIGSARSRARNSAAPARSPDSA